MRPNSKANGRYRIEAQIEDALTGKKTSVRVQDSDDGVYNLTYILTKSGQYRMHVAMDGEAAAASPFHIEVHLLVDSNNYSAYPVLHVFVRPMFNPVFGSVC